MKLLELLQHDPVLRDAALSLGWIVVVLLLRVGALRMVRHKSWTSDRTQLRITSQLRRGAWLLIVAGLVLLWATELRTMALSLVAFAAALIIATKELLLCAMGSLLRTSAQAYTIGDRVLIGSTHGDVVDSGLFATTLLEVGPGHRWTGRTLTVPNSALLTGPVINETATGDYVLHTITVPMDSDEDWRSTEESLLRTAAEVCEPYIDEERAQLVESAQRIGHAAPSLEPKVILQLPEAGKLSLQLRLPTPARARGEIEQRVLRALLGESSAND